MGKTDTSKKTWKLPEDSTKSAFSKVVFMRPAKVYIYQVFLSDLNTYSMASYLAIFFFSGAMALWTGHFTAWHNTGVLVSAALGTFAAFIFLGIAIWKHIKMTRHCEEAPYGKD